MGGLTTTTTTFCDSNINTNIAKYGFNLIWGVTGVTSF